MRKEMMGMAACAAALATALLSPAAALADAGGSMHRLYNPNSGEHFYTASRVERDRLQSVGWSYERVAWEAPDSGEDVYRLYNPNGGDHHYTTSAGERDLLVAEGWSNEGSGWKSGGGVAVYRLYNPSAATGAHHYTTSAGERDLLVAAGWSNEGVGWYASSAGSEPEPSNYLAGSNWLIELPEYWLGKVSIRSGYSHCEWFAVYVAGVDEPEVEVMFIKRYTPDQLKFMFEAKETGGDVTLPNGQTSHIYDIASEFGTESFRIPMPDGGCLEVFASQIAMYELPRGMTDADRQVVMDMQALGTDLVGDDPARYARELCLTELAAHTYVF
ncbi:MAG: hypothetical protein Q4B54_06955 [Coriobacteriales bacterium]|nr:hypothetical protein [Coriobacteriales bacterium]